MSKRGISKKDLFNQLAALQEQISILRDQNASLLNAARAAVQEPHSKNCWSLQKKNPGKCTCQISDLKRAIAKAEEGTFLKSEVKP